MAITNAQQFKQLVNPPMKGNKRPGYRGDAAARSSGAAQSGRADPGSRGDPGEGRASKDSGVSRDTGGFAPTKGIGANVGPTGRDDLVRQSLLNQAKEFRALQQEKRKGFSIPENIRLLTLKNQIDQIRGLKPKIGGLTTIGNIFNPSLVDGSYTTDDDDEDDYFEGTDFGITGSNLEREQNIKDAITKAEDTGGITQKEFEDAFYSGRNYSLDDEGKIVSKPKPRPGLTGNGDGDGINQILPLFAQAPSTEEEKEEEETFTPNFRLMADGGRAGFAGGGMPYEGGIMDLESSRQMYGLGKLVKKVTRSVKKIAKSPIGKAAIGAALFHFGKPFIKSDTFKNFMFEGGVPGFKTLTNKGVLAGIGGISALAGLMTPKEEEEDETRSAGADLPFPVDYYLSGQYTPNRRLAAEGGSMKEPVAKKTMPLLDMDGQEMDLRAEGGFVPLGRMEKADDVPARLSKNEFVFTANAVRNAGDGDVDKGAEVMYNMMKNLESGGDVSEESQGLEGARQMFQTSQRLEEVI